MAYVDTQNNAADGDVISNTTEKDDILRMMDDMQNSQVFMDTIYKIYEEDLKENTSGSFRENNITKRILSNYFIITKKFKEDFKFEGNRSNYNKLKGYSLHSHKMKKFGCNNALFDCN